MRKTGVIVAVLAACAVLFVLGGAWILRNLELRAEPAKPECTLIEHAHQECPGQRNADR